MKNSENNCFRGTGRRKTSVARVIIRTGGSGKFLVNGLECSHYFGRPTLKMLVYQPLELTDHSKKVDVSANIRGGGLSGQAGALRHGISRALLEMDSSLRASLKSEGFLTRDSRMKESKHYGHKKARKSFQFSKR